MKTDSLIIPLAGPLTAEETGSKAQSLLFLKRKGLAVPRSFLIPSSVHADYLRSPEEVQEKLRREVELLPDVQFAIRSSAEGEDGARLSCAGQFLTLTNRRGGDQILMAIKEVWSSAARFTGGDYSRWAGQGSHSPACAVIIQDMVGACYAGVSFSRNPVTGASEIIIEAVEGPGEELVQKGLTPLRWKFRSKEIQEGETSHPLFPVIKKVAAATAKLTKSTGYPVDVEWAFDGQKLWFLQLRRITGETHLTKYSSRMAKEMLPGPVKPLVWSVNIPLVVGAKIALAEEISGPLNIRPEELVRSFHYRTYFNLDKMGEILHQFGLSPEAVETVMRGDHSHMHGFRPGWKIFKHALRIIRFLRKKFNYPNLFEAEYLQLKESSLALQKELQLHFSPADYGPLYEKLYRNGQRLAHFNIVIPVLMRMISRRLFKKMEKAGIPFDQKQVAAVFPQFEELSPAVQMEKIRITFKGLPFALRAKINSPQDFQDHPETTTLAAGFTRLMDRFGHFSFSGNDFSVPKWEENPDEVWKMIVSSSDSSPVADKEPFLSTSDIEASENSNVVGGGIKLPRKLRKLWLKAGRLMVYREQISSLYIFGYGLFRTFYLHAGKWLTDRALLDDREDIFYLTREEAEAAVSALEYQQPPDLKEVVARRRKEMEESRDDILPTEIYGEEAPLIPRGSLRHFRGTGVSPGFYQGKVRILHQESDFGKVTRGDVLVIPFSDVSWTPILMKAGAIVSESGGMLSHCSIIARELGIPALVSVDHACSIEEGSQVTVDGSNGFLTVHDDE